MLILTLVLYFQLLVFALCQEANRRRGQGKDKRKGRVKTRSFDTALQSETSLERRCAEVAIDEQTVYGFEVEFTSFLCHELDGEEFGIAFFEEEVVATIHKSGVECFLSRSVQAVVGEIHHILHSFERDTFVFEFVRFIGETEGEGIDIVEVFTRNLDFHHVTSLVGLHVGSQH